jgi:pimeloyl-ACP methyl ester carboxylesterase
VRSDEAFFFDVEGLRLFACLHKSHRVPRATSLGLVLCHAFGDEHIGCYRGLRGFAGVLACAGIAALRFDHRGYGDSEGDFEHATLERMVADVCGAIDELQTRTGVERVGLLGVRLGCSVALRVALADLRVTLVAAWSPVLAARRFFDRLLRRQVLQAAMYGLEQTTVKAAQAELAAGRSVEIGGYLLGGSVHAQFCSRDIAELLREFAGSAQVVLPNRGSARPSATDCEALAASLRPEVELCSVDEGAFWEFPLEGCLPRRARGGVVSAATLEEPVHIAGADGELFAIRHSPPGSVCGAGILVVDSRVEYRVGPHRIFVHGARRWAASGFHVLAMD